MTSRVYRGVAIGRVHHSGMWCALTPRGWVRADTLAGIRELIRWAMS